IARSIEPEQASQPPATTVATDTTPLELDFNEFLDKLGKGADHGTGPKWDAIRALCTELRTYWSDHDHIQELVKACDKAQKTFFTYLDQVYSYWYTDDPRTFSEAA